MNEGVQATWAGELLEGGGDRAKVGRGWGGDPALPAAALLGLVWAKKRRQSAGQIQFVATCSVSTLSHAFQLQLSGSALLMVMSGA